MANTVFQHKRSGTPASVPSVLEFGELAINYADGLIFYKNATSHIVSISGGGGGNAFGTINANGTLVVSDTAGDVLNLVAGTNVTFSVDAVNDIITINASGGGGDVSAPFAAANAAFLAANSAFANGNTTHTLTIAAFSAANTKLANTSGVTFAGDLTITGNVGIGTAQTSSFRLEVGGAFAATTKSFIIDHPTKPGHRLRYASLEGPENGVYIRGKSYSNVIELPDYWEGLVDEDTITAQITPFGAPQNLYVWRISNNIVYIEGSEPMSYYYTVYAERKDVDKLIVEI